MSRLNTSGVIGVSYDKCRNYWKARVHIEGDQVTLKSNKDYFEVVCAVKSYNAKGLTGKE